MNHKVMSNTDYHKHSAMGNSKLNLFARDENSIEWADTCPVDTEKMKALDFGDAMHAICLEPDRLVNDFITMPKFDGRTTVGKKDKAQFIAAHIDKKLLTADEGNKLNLMYESVMSHPAARKLVEAQGICEASFFWKDPDTGIECKCRPDKLIEGTPHPIDVKTTESLAKFKFSVEDYKYYIQDPFYCDGLKANDVEAEDMWFLVIQKTIELGRYPVMVVSIPDEVIAYGRDTYKRNLGRYAEYMCRNGMQMSQELEMHNGFMAKIENDIYKGIT